MTNRIEAGWSRVSRVLRGTILHPQWLTDRFHDRFRRECLGRITDCRALDIGSGNSRVDLLVGDGTSVIRFDYPETNRRYRLVPDVFGDARRLPFVSGSFDAVFLFEVLEHLPDEHDVLSEVRRVLRPGGRLLISVPFLYPLHDRPHDHRRYTIYGLRSLLAQHGFAPQQEMQLGNSFLVAIQFANLALLEFGKAAASRGTLPGLLVAAFVYPLSLVGNILGLPALGLNRFDAACFGYFLVTVRS
jgi:SAM-dependent methyltransferase